jgi:hypothetical protein
LILIDNTEFKLSNYFKNYDSGFLFEKYDTLDECIAQHGDESWVVMETSEIFRVNTITPSPLKNFTHPINNVVYLFGPDFGAVNYDNIVNLIPVYIEMGANNPLYAISASNIVLYDRFIKKI